MIYGVGNDIIEIARVAKACEKEGFLRKYFTEREIELFSKYPQSLAGNFAAKEAVVKAMGTGFRGFYSDSIEILRDEKGKPYVITHGEAKRICEEAGISKFHVSISHTAEYATAVAVAEQV